MKEQYRKEYTIREKTLLSTLEHLFNEDIMNTISFLKIETKHDFVFNKMVNVYDNEENLLISATKNFAISMDEYSIKITEYQDGALFEIYNYILDVLEVL